MCDKKNYLLLSIDEDCIRDSENINIASPDLTSILNSLEKKENPLKHYFADGPNNRITNSVEDKLNNLSKDLDNVKLWLDRTLIPSMMVMKEEDVNKCLTKLKAIDETLGQMRDIHTKTKIHFNTRRYVGLTNEFYNDYKYPCNICPKNIVTNGSDPWTALQNHEHVEENIYRGAPLFYRNKIQTEPSKQHPSSSNKMDEPQKISATNVNKTSENNSTVVPRLCKYDWNVITALYPPELTSKICYTERNHDFYTTINVCGNRYHCMLCTVDLFNSHGGGVMAHIAGNRHQRKIEDITACRKVILFHKIFTDLPKEFQIHQVVFRPYSKFPAAFCKVCGIAVVESDILYHILGSHHSQRLIKRNFAKYNLYAEMVAQISSCSDEVSEEDSSEMSVKSLVIYNKENSTKLQNATPTNSSENKTVSPKEELNSDDDSDCESSENSLKTKVVNTNNPKASDLKLTEMFKTLTTKEDIPGDNKSIAQTEVKEPLDNTKKIVQTDSKSEQENGKPTQVNSKPNQANNTPAVPVKHNIIPSVTSNPKDAFDLLENRYQQHREFLKYFDFIPTCTLCSVSFVNSLGEMRKHFISDSHKKNAKSILGKLKYEHYCDLCYKFIHNDVKWFDHLNCVEHRQRVESTTKIKEPRAGPFIEYECTTCSTVIFGNKTSINKHLREVAIASRRQKKPKVIKISQQLEMLMKSEQLFNEKIEKLCRESTAVLKSIDLSWECCKAIEKALEPVFGMCSAYPFGSRVSGLGNVYSDLDVFVDTGSMYSGLIYQDADSQARLVTLTARTLKKHSDFMDVFSIPGARTPIVQVFHKGTGLDCDLSFRHGLSVENTSYLKLCIDCQPQLKSLIMFLKHWSALSKMSDKISTYAFAMMSIFFLQVKGYLPSVKRIRELDPAEPVFIGGWQTYSYTKPVTELQKEVIPCDISIRELIAQFFEYYIHFKYNTEVVCPLLGHTVLKADFHEDKGKRLPPEMKQYVRKINLSEENEVFRSMSPMGIQDPFDLSHNLTKACSNEVVTRFTALCRLSYAILSKK